MVIPSSIWDSAQQKRHMTSLTLLLALVGPPAECGGVQRNHGRCGQGQPVARCFGPPGGLGWRSWTMHWAYWYALIHSCFMLFFGDIFRYLKNFEDSWEPLGTLFNGGDFFHIASPLEQIWKQLFFHHHCHHYPSVSVSIHWSSLVHWSGHANHHAVDPRRCQRALLQLFDWSTLVTHCVRQVSHWRQDFWQIW